MEIQLQDNERSLLRNILERYLGDLRAEIYKTENSTMRNDLKTDEETIKSLLTRLPGTS